MTVPLPIPTPEEVREFQQVYKREFGIELTDKEAWEAVTRTLRLFCLATYGLPSDDASKQR
jgi:hypothetical protein